MTIVTSDQPQLGFGKGRFGWVVDTITKLATEYGESVTGVPVKYLKLPPTGCAISQKHKKASKFANVSYSKLQTNFRRRARKPRRRYNNRPYRRIRSRQLRWTNRSKQRGTNWRQYIINSGYANVYQSGERKFPTSS